ncbi:Glycoprotein-N-acetylgalactosamine 3-beta-galactosyltransferase [Actinidia chinensis var. chinensis]|uniref:Glycoprotein-N-acetylgalactosamine 3-beta-galactosyltransferase n=1 Tax=Actinidia chinensis var. chinensis TaxID=1590841 RepID=A0A2R6PFL0_ACTCC|nr:Glycoprotein-N-acetylgalactosamine 3-beta-galactosyltransferase [Actinidia chinensis var. chinensis]
MNTKLPFSTLHFTMNLFKTLAITGLVLYLAYIIFFTESNCPSSDFFSPLQHIFTQNSQTILPPPPTSNTTNVSHLIFGLVGSLNAWWHRKAYIESWWRPNVTRGYLFLDTAPTAELLPWSAASPPLRVSDDISGIVRESKHVAPVMVRMVHAILEVFREGDQGVRWIVMGDDDSIFFVDNWVDVLAKYDHTKYVYIGGHSETILSNFYYSFDQGFGGAGFALSYPLAAAMVKDLEGCLKRYPYLNSADLITQYCVDELGVSLSDERGIHQIDLKGDISGFLSSHPQSPLLSLHHFDVVDPIFPAMDRFQSVNHLMKAAKADQSRLLQQTICYHRPTNWSLSVSWGYSAHIYEKVLPRSFLKRPLETFRTWIKKPHPPHYMFNTRWPPFSDPCDAPHVFFFQSVENETDHIVSTYVRSSPRGLPACSASGNHSADFISRVQVVSPTTKLVEAGRSECCDIVHAGDNNVTEIKYRACKDDEIIA